MTNLKHHPFGPSSMRRRELCPASMRLEEGLPEPPTSPEAGRGSRIHDLTAGYIQKGEALEPQTEEQELALKCFEYWQRVFLPEEEAEKMAVGKVEHRVEYRVIKDDPETQLYFGTADFIGLFNESERGLIIDWKTGFLETDPAPDNIQGAAYALALMQEFDLKECAVHFYNPTQNRASSHVFTDAEALARHIMRVHNLCLAPDTPPRPGEDQCRYCRAFYHGTCAGVKKELAKIAELAPELEGSIKSLSDEQLADFFEKTKVVAKAKDLAEKELRERIERDGSCAGHRIKLTSGGFDLPDIGAAFNLSGLSEKEFLKCCKLSESQLKKAWAKAQVNGGEYKTLKEAEFAFASVFGGLRCPKPPKRTLVKEDTKALN